MATLSDYLGYTKRGKKKKKANSWEQTVRRQQRRQRMPKTSGYLSDPYNWSNPYWAGISSLIKSPQVGRETTRESKRIGRQRRRVAGVSTGGGAGGTGGYGSGGGGGGGGAGGEPEFSPLWFKGQWYDSPKALAKKMSGFYRKRAGQQRGTQEALYTGNIREMGRERTKLREDLGEAEEKGLLNLANYYGAISPDAYQSSQLSSEKALSERVGKERTRGEEDLDWALSQGAMNWENTKIGLQDWLDEKIGEVTNSLYDIKGKKVVPGGAPNMQFQAPVRKWNLAEALGGITGMGKYYSKGSSSRAIGKYGKRASVGKSATKGQSSAILKHLYPGYY